MTPSNPISQLSALQWPGGLRPVASTHVVDFEWGGNKWTRTYVRSPAFDSPTEVYSWLFHEGVEPSRCRVFRGHGYWAGSGEVTRG